jgi:uncharacterized membrane protein HdeD (DUF308 family)
MAFAAAAGNIAPKAKFITSIVVASAYSAVGIFAVIVAIANHFEDHPKWLMITTTIICIVGAMAGCAMIQAIEEGHKKEELKKSQLN